MADLSDYSEEELTAIADAEAEAEFEFQQSKAKGDGTTIGPDESTWFDDVARSANAFGRSASNMATFGLTDEVRGLGKYLSRKIVNLGGPHLPDLSLGEAVESERDLDRAFKESNPEASFGGSLVGGGAMPFPTGVSSVKGLAGASGASGAALGFGEGEGEDGFVNRLMNAGKAGTLSTLLGGGLAGLAKGGANAYRYLFPHKKTAEVAEAGLDGITAGVQGAPKGTTGRESQLVDDVIQKEGTFLKLNPMGGINPKDPKAFELYRANLGRMKDGAKAQKADILAKADAALGDDGVRLSQSELQAAAQAEGLHPDALAAAQDSFANSRYKLGQGVTEVGGETVQTAGKSIKASEVDTLIGDIDSELAALGNYDDLFQSKIATDPSTFEKVRQKIEGLKFLRRTAKAKLSEAVEGSVGGASKLQQANDEISTLIEYENLAERFAIETLQGTTPVPGRSLLSSVQGANPKNLFGKLFGGKLSQGGAVRDRMQNLERGGEAVRRLQEIPLIRSGQITSPEAISGNTLSNVARAGTLFANTGGVQAAQAQENSMGIFKPNMPFPQGLPRDTSQWSEQAIGQLGADAAQRAEAPVVQGLSMHLLKALRAGDKRKAEKIVYDLSRLVPDLFEPGRGVNNKLWHPEDQATYMAELDSLQRKGGVSSSFLAQQRDSFLDPNDGRILDLMPETGIGGQQPNNRVNFNIPPQEVMGELKPRNYPY